MTNLTQVDFELPVFHTLREGPLTLEQHAVPVELELTEGEHLFTSTPTKVGTFLHFEVFGHISIPYSYDAELQYVTICGPEDSSERQLSIHMSLEQHPELISSHRVNDADTSAAPNMWTNFVNKNPEVKQATKAAARRSIDALVQRLLDAGVQGVIQTGPAPVVTPTNYADYKAMFAPDKEDVDQPSVEDILEVQLAAQSTYGGTVTWSLNYAFANVIGSTHDPKPPGYSSWIQLWADTCNNGYYPTKCSSYNYANGHTPFDCNTYDFVGGHVIPGTTAKSVATGGTAYIFPIGKRHNGNDNIYMSMRYNPTGVVLKNYNQW